MSCALCSAPSAIQTELPQTGQSLALCETCQSGQAAPVEDAPHWQCLHDAIWSPDALTQVAAYRCLSHLQHAPWARDLLDIVSLEPETLALAEAGLPREAGVIHLDANGAPLQAGDTVTLIKDLPVKGAGFTAKRGTAVRSISLVADNPDHIEGRVQGQRIVILTQFVKKS